MMKRLLANFLRHRYWYLAAIVLIGGGIYFLVPGRQGKITLANLHKIKKGMTEKEVEEILGQPGAQDSARAQYRPVLFGKVRFHGPPLESKYWDGEQGTICMQFSEGR